MSDVTNDATVTVDIDLSASPWGDRLAACLALGGAPAWNALLTPLTAAVIGLGLMWSSAARSALATLGRVRGWPVDVALGDGLRCRLGHPADTRRGRGEVLRRRLGKRVDP